MLATATLCSVSAEGAPHGIHRIEPATSWPGIHAAGRGAARRRAVGREGPPLARSETLMAGS